MKKYHAYQNTQTKANYIPFYRLTASSGSRKEYTPYITNGVITVQLTPNRKGYCQEVEIDEAEFLELTKDLGIKEISNCKAGDIFENFGYVFILEIYEISDKYMNLHGLSHKTRSLHHSPIYSEKYGSIDCV